VLHSVAGVWLPTEVALEHYRAVEELALPTAEQLDIGRNVAHRLEGTFLGTVIKMSASVGVTPWLGLERFGRIYDRLFVGGGCAIFKVGPKEARIEMVGVPLAAIAYFRVGLRGMTEAGCELFCKKAYAHEIPRLCSANVVTIRVAWV
jgi:hypothetical protein